MLLSIPVALRYFYKLRKAKTAFPRRQEAEGETCTLSNGSEVSAIVSREEIKEWAAGAKKAIICSVSHSWETREHPDPCRFQLEQIVNYVSLFDAAYFDDIWLFYDYVSLFQFQRTPEEDVHFQAAMGNIHMFYAHNLTRTFRIESLTPERVWRAMLENPAEQVRVYFEEAKAVTPRPLKDLVENRVPYSDRGWCKAEVEWSSTRDFTAKSQRIDAAEGKKKGSGLKGRVPTTPELFKAQMASAKFTHRADAGSVQFLQAKIYHQKVSVCQEAVLEHLPAAEVTKLAAALPHYQQLRTLRVRNFECGPHEAKALGEAGLCLNCKDWLWILSCTK